MMTTTTPHRLGAARSLLLAAVASLVSATTAEAKVTYRATNLTTVAGWIQSDSQYQRRFLGLIARKLADAGTPGNFAALGVPQITTILGRLDADTAPILALESIGEVATYITTVHRFDNGHITTSSLPAFLAEQRVLNQLLDHAPSILRNKAVTVGFEHEFLKHVSSENIKNDKLNPIRSQLTDCDRSLTGLDHVELYKTSEQSTDYFGHIPFKIETDSDDELELVTPPFLMRVRDTTPAVPFPRYDHILQYEEMMTTELTALNDLVAKATAPIRLPQLVGELRKRGVPFDDDEVTLSYTNLSVATPAVDLPGKDGVLGKDRLAKICLLSANKGDQLINHQVNLVTSAPVYTSLLLWNKQLTRAPKKLRDQWAVLEPTISAAYRTAWADNKPAERLQTLPMKMFFIELIGSTVNHAAVPALETYRAYLEDRAVNGLQNTALQDKARAMMDDIEGYTSYVKDWRGIWLKTTFANHARALGLSADDVANINNVLGSDAVKNGIEAIPDVDLQRAFEGITKVATVLPEAYATTFNVKAVKDAMALAYRKVANLLNDKAFVTRDLDGAIEVASSQRAASVGWDGWDLKRRVRYSEHDPKYIGVRQDTFARAELPTLWTEPLVLVEARDDPGVAPTDRNPSPKPTSHPLLKAVDDTVAAGGATALQEMIATNWARWVSGN